MDKQNLFSFSSCENALRQTGMRVNFKATRMFREIIEEYANRTANLAAEAARHSKRMTIKVQDLEFVSRIK